ncbi:MAG: hypothetical protein WCX30_03000 [Candidatus Paceibacterota bacterium]|jgi:hypothetical protein|nr:hypothetical protein [bacterium]
MEVILMKLAIKKIAKKGSSKNTTILVFTDGSSLKIKDDYFLINPIEMITWIFNVHDKKRDPVSMVFFANEIDEGSLSPVGYYYAMNVSGYYGFEFAGCNSFDADEHFWKVFIEDYRNEISAITDNRKPKPKSIELEMIYKMTAIK